MHLVRFNVSFAQMSSLRSIDLSFNGLRHLPAEICLLPQLNRLDVTHNKLCELPDAIGMMRGLRDLMLDSNRLTSLPDSLYEIKGLVKLSVANNRIARLDRRIGQLTCLIALHVDNNPLESLPSEAGLLPFLRHVSSANCKFLDEESCRPKKRAPLPSLTELAARALLRHSIAYAKDDDDAACRGDAGALTRLPASLARYLASAERCSFCAGPMFEAVVTRYRFVNRNLVSIPLEFSLCSAHWNADKERVAALFKPRPKSAPRRIDVGQHADAPAAAAQEDQAVSRIAGGASVSNVPASPTLSSMRLQRRPSNSSLSIKSRRRTETVVHARKQQQEAVVFVRPIAQAAAAH